ncbi:MAG: LegC family aminotransferase [Bacteroidota bacterium]
MTQAIDFIRSIYRTSGPIPLYTPIFAGNEKKYLGECIDYKNVSTVSPFVNKFEESLVKFTGSKYAVATINGTSALHLALLLLDIKTGDEVITQPLTYVATANAITYTGAKPVFIDIDKKTLGLSPLKLEQFLKEETIRQDGKCYNKTTKAQIKAILPMHSLGIPSEIEKLSVIAQEYEIPIIEDAAEGLGSFYKNQHVGTFGKMGILSFNGNKTITTGGGGALLTNDKDLAERALNLSTTAKIKHPYKSMHSEVAFNYRLPGLNAAMGLAQMEPLEDILDLKRKLAQKYKIFFENTELKFFIFEKDRNSNHWMNVVECPTEDTRNNFVEALNKSNINARPIWTLMNNLKMYEHCQTGNLENAVRAAKTIALLPSGVDTSINLK